MTNAEYARFIAEGGYNPDRPWWTEHGRAWLRQQKLAQPVAWDHQQYNAPAQPVVAVSWYEAVAYCGWLTERGHHEGWLPSDMLIRLPTYPEWVRAARGTGRQRYPWGDAAPDPQRANYDDTGVGRPSPVGCFPVGQAGCGAQDLLGNVWEWTATMWKQPAQHEPIYDSSQRESLIITSTGFPSSNERLCCGARFRNFPNYRDYNVGFRVVWSPRSLV